MSFIEIHSNGLVYSSATNITALTAFTTRFGGVSQGIYSSLNLSLSSDDSAENILANYTRLADALGISPAEFVCSHQVHKSDIRVVSETDRRIPVGPPEYEADGLVTNIPNLPLIIYSADCIPILLHDPVNGCIGAAHAGWRGTMLDIAGKAVQKMCSEYGSKPQNIRAAIGPGIGKCCYETGAEVFEAAINNFGSDYSVFCEKSGDKYHVDLKSINKARLICAGLIENNITVSPECTMCNHDKYWSHRYTNGQRGVQGSLIMLKG